MMRKLMVYEVAHGGMELSSGDKRVEELCVEVDRGLF